MNAAVTKKDSEVRRGAINKSVAVIGPQLDALLPFYTLLVETAERCCDIKGTVDECRQRHLAILRSCLDAINSTLAEAEAARCALLPGATTALSAALQRKAWYTAVGDRSRRVTLTKVLSPFVLRHSCVVPLHPCILSDFCGARSSLTTLVELLKEKLFVVISAILGMRRVVVFSKVQSATVVCEAVLSLGILGQAVDPHYLSQRVFPYTSINFMTMFRGIAGFIVGTVNPMYETQTRWWDVFVDLDANTVTTATPELEDTLVGKSLPHVVSDMEAYKNVSRGIVHQRAMMASVTDVEQYVRQFLMEHMCMCVLSSQGTLVASRRGLPERFVTLTTLAQKRRATDWMVTDMRDISARFCERPEAQIVLLVSTLRRSHDFEDFELMQLVQELLRLVQSEDDMLQLLIALPAALDGLSPLVSKIFHGSLPVRMTVVALLRKIDASLVGRPCLAKVNGFLLNAFESLAKDLPDTSAAY